MEDQKKAKLKAEAALRAIQFPHTSKMVAPNIEISLANETVANWVGVFFPEIAHLHRSANRKISFQSSNGKEVTLLRCFGSSSKNEFMVTANQTRFVERLVSVLAGNKLREADVIDCLRAQLDKLVKSNNAKNKVRLKIFLVL